MRVVFLAMLVIAASAMDCSTHETCKASSPCLFELEDGLTECGPADRNTQAGGVAACAEGGVMCTKFPADEPNVPCATIECPSLTCEEGSIIKTYREKDLEADPPVCCAVQECERDGVVEPPLGECANTACPSYEACADGIAMETVTPMNLDADPPVCCAIMRCKEPNDPNAACPTGEVMDEADPQGGCVPVSCASANACMPQFECVDFEIPTPCFRSPCRQYTCKEAQDEPCGDMTLAQAETMYADEKCEFDRTTCKCVNTCNVAAVDCDTEFNFATCKCAATAPTCGDRPLLAVMEECDGYFNRETCVCTPKPETQMCADGVSFDRARENCDGHFFEATCKCEEMTLPPLRVCPNGMSYYVAMRECVGYAAGTSVWDAETCECKPRQLDDDAVPCANELSYAANKKACVGLTAFPQTHTWNPTKCTCDEREVVVETMRTPCSPFPTCTKDVPCLTREGVCKPANAVGKCEIADSRTCTSFGLGFIGGETCPDGTPYDAYKARCLSQDNARFHPAGCRCEIAQLTCPDDSSIAEAEAACMDSDAKNVFFNRKTCKCEALETCPNMPGLAYDVAKTRCTDAKYEFMANCECRPVEIREDACGAFKSYADAKESCLSRGAANVVFIPETCECLPIKPVEEPVVSITVFEMKFTVEVTAPLEVVMAQKTRLVMAFNERFANEFSGASLQLVDTKSDESKTQLVLLVRTQNKAEAEAIKEWAVAFAAEESTQALVADLLGNEAALTVTTEGIEEVQEDVFEDAAMATAPTMLVVAVSALAFLRL